MAGLCSAPTLDMGLLRRADAPTLELWAAVGSAAQQIHTLFCTFQQEFFACLPLHLLKRVHTLSGENAIGLAV